MGFFSKARKSKNAAWSIANAGSVSVVPSESSMGGYVAPSSVSGETLTDVRAPSDAPEVVVDDRSEDVYNGSEDDIDVNIDYRTPPYEEAAREIVTVDDGNKSTVAAVNDFKSKSVIAASAVATTSTNNTKKAISRRLSGTKTVGGDRNRTSTTTRNVSSNATTTTARPISDRYRRSLRRLVNSGNGNSNVVNANNKVNQQRAASFSSNEQQTLDTYGQTVTTRGVDNDDDEDIDTYADDTYADDTYADEDNGTFATDYKSFNDDDDDDDETMKKDQSEMPHNPYDPEDQTVDSAFTITRRDGQFLTQNGFANGHLMRWKFAAEEGPPLLRIPAVLLAISVICTTVYPLIAVEQFWTPSLLILAGHTVLQATCIIILEARVLGVRDPTNGRARLRFMLTRYWTILKLVWGRGVLYISAGSLNLTSGYEYVIYSGFGIIGLGVIMVCVGAHASYHLDTLKSSLTDPGYLYARFTANDDDDDDRIGINGFAQLLWSLGMEFDDAYTFQTFQQIDTDGDSLITFEEFRNWWITKRVSRQRIRVSRGDQGVKLLDETAEDDGDDVPARPRDRFVA